MPEMKRSIEDLIKRHKELLTFGDVRLFMVRVAVMYLRWHCTNGSITQFV